MKGISKTAHAGLSPPIPAVLAPPEVVTQAALGFYSATAMNPSGGAPRNEGAGVRRLRPAFQQAARGQQWLCGGRARPSS